jgi:2-amino-4-hydroxy-6-hydroxymethyldihydropteridine diphosphokinase
MRAGIALGSNIEPRFDYLQAAHRRLLDLHTGVEPVLCSKIYETSPVGCPPGSPPFLNAVLEISTESQPQQLLRSLKSIESALGRRPAPNRNTPRTIDLDLLYCDDVILSESDLTLPHPQISQRRFVLEPLADIRPDLVLPLFERSVKESLDQLKNDEVLRVYSNLN